MSSLHLRFFRLRILFRVHGERFDKLKRKNESVSGEKQREKRETDLHVSPCCSSERCEEHVEP